MGKHMQSKTRGRTWSETKLFNNALLAKWKLRLGTKRQCIWKDIL